MSLSSIAKGGWHPKGKDGGKESWRGDFKGINTIANKFGKGKDSSAAEAARNHQSTPLSALKDPSLFAPPPKHIGYHGGIAAPNTTTPDRSGWGAPTPKETLAPQRALQSQAQLDAEAEAEAEANRPVPPPMPYRANTTGLTTDNLPKPPVRIIAPTEEASQPTQTSKLSVAATTTPRQQSKPQPPPRLPPRQNSHPDVHSPAPPPAYSPLPNAPTAQQSGGYLNQASLNRLGQAGVSVPGFDIGRATSPSAQNNGIPPSLGKQPANSTNHLSELQSRFSGLSTNTSQAKSPNSGSATVSSNTSNGGTTWAQKQRALQTAASFHQNPSSVSFADAKDAASTANNFRQRHGDQVASGWKTAQKYGVADKIGHAVGTMSSEGEQSQRAGTSSAQANSGSLTTTAAFAAAKKAPPPPPKKKNLMVSSVEGQQGVVEDGGAPPPVPLASKPR